MLPATHEDRYGSHFNPSTVQSWLETVHGRSEGWIWIGSTHDRFRGRAFPARAVGWMTAAMRYMEYLDRTNTAGIYLRTTTLAQAPRKGRGGDDDSLSLPGLAADLDIAGPGHKSPKPLPPDPVAARAIIDESGLPDPSIWVHSGGGLYAWWLLDKPHTIGADLARIKRLGMRWQDPIAAAAERLGYSHGRLGDLARILRIPGTVNRKPAMPEPKPCRILEDTGRRYTLTNLREVLTDALAALPAPEPVVLRFRIQGGGADGLRPGDDFNLRADWADILGPHGWTFSHEQGHTRYWWRPGKDRRESHSATTGRDPSADRLWVFSDATVFPQDNCVSKFRAYSILNHGGDDKAAARELRRLGFGGRRVAA